MQLGEFLARLQQHYVDQLRAFVLQQRTSGKQGSPEVKLKLSEESSLFQRLYCVDYIEKAEEGHRVIEMMPDRIVTFDPVTFTRGGLDIRVESLCWDSVEILFDGEPPSVDAWYDRWFDPEEKNFDATAELSGKVHSLSVEPGSIYIDCGSAPAEALISLFDLLSEHGVRSVIIRTERKPE